MVDIHCAHRHKLSKAILQVLIVCCNRILETILQNIIEHLCLIVIGSLAVQESQEQEVLNLHFLIRFFLLKLFRCEYLIQKRVLLIQILKVFEVSRKGILQLSDRHSFFVVNKLFKAAFELSDLHKGEGQSRFDLFISSQRREVFVLECGWLLLLDLVLLIWLFFLLLLLTGGSVDYHWL